MQVKILKNLLQNFSARNSHSEDIQSMQYRYFQHAHTFDEYHFSAIQLLVIRVQYYLCIEILQYGLYEYNIKCLAFWYRCSYYLCNTFH